MSDEPQGSSVASCSGLSQDVPLIGTASVQTTYVVVDCPKPWAAKIQASSAFPRREALERAHALQLSFGLLGRVGVGSRPALTVYRYLTGRVTEVTLALEDPELGDKLVAALTDTLSSGSEARPALLVCTHGSRDRCCGTLGVPLLKAVRETSSPREVVEVSHLGGHRFAPTCLAIPEWRVFGRVAPSRVVELLESLEAGDSAQLKWLRGHSALDPASQVLEHAWALEEGRVPSASLPAPSSSEPGVRCLFHGQTWQERRATLTTTSWSGISSCVDIARAKSSEGVSYQFSGWLPLTETLPTAASLEQMEERL
jgi:hypothetical protein